MSEHGGLHNLIIENRKRLLMTGVKEVLNFSDDTINAVTEQGEITVRGSELKIDNFNTEKGDLTAGGNIIAVVYTAKGQREGFFGRLLR